MKKDKNDKTHTQQDANTYYSIFKDVSDEVFIEAMKNVLLDYQYFPRIDELNLCIKQVIKNKTNWKDKTIEKEPISKEEAEELKKLLEEFRD